MTTWSELKEQVEAQHSHDPQRAHTEWAGDCLGRGRVAPSDWGRVQFRDRPEGDVVRAGGNSRAE